ncbi:YesL family protein [Lachnobacterium bovis]|uniref:Uncharacterized membrane protein YesL n=1 Tax=Lachnobacterium bovis TaxID=140626 RepID=A0A1H9R078_9FIRM|nr:YesL family protein [Lachnobacterium bovis]SER65915.1 Uncharacterized membrane protein YesL [Lachnobacterium bovis]
MGKFFNLDNPIMNFISKLSDTLWLNILWLVTSLPIVTIGPATAALYHVTLNMADDRSVCLTADYFKGFKENFKKGTALGLVLTGLGIILGIDGYVFLRMKFVNPIWTLGFAAFIPISVLFLVVCIYAFPLQAMFDNTLKALLKNALLIGIRYLFCTISLVIIHVSIFYIAINYFTPLIFLGEGLCAFLSSYLLRPLFVSLSEE